MIKTEYYMTRPDGVRLFRTYSDERYRIIQNDTGNIYDEAMDVEGTNHTYSESEELIEYEEIENLNEVAQAMLRNGFVTLNPGKVNDPDYLNENEPEPNYFNG